ncbi:hypothetical protein APY03_6942 [Variovorax sp. WDL1]|nr:hypothetical protein APY03_6942 [Variovorax sp. WDL1]
MADLCCNQRPDFDKVWRKFKSSEAWEASKEKTFVDVANVQPILLFNDFPAAIDIYE